MLIRFTPAKHDVRELYGRRGERFGESEEIAQAVVKFINKQFEIHHMPYEVKEECGGEFYVLDKETNKEIWQADDEPCDLQAFFDLMNNAECCL